MENDEPDTAPHHDVRHEKGVAQGDPATHFGSYISAKYDLAEPDTTWSNPGVACYPTRLLAGDADNDGDLTDRDAEADEDVEEGPPPLEEIPGSQTQDDDMDLSLGDVGGSIQTASLGADGQSFTNALIARNEKGKGRTDLPLEEQTERYEESSVGQQVSLSALGEQVGTPTNDYAKGFIVHRDGQKGDEDEDHRPKKRRRGEEDMLDRKEVSLCSYLPVLANDKLMRLVESPSVKGDRQIGGSCRTPLHDPDPGDEPISAP